jgi:molecular chaperone DnaK (HSP70)
VAPIVGIDFGVAHCRTAMVRGGKVEAFRTRFSEQLLPLLVVDANKDGSRRHDGAKENGLFHTVKHFVGTADDTVAFEGGVTAAQAAGELFRSIRDDANESAGEDVSRAVVTVPALFTERRRAALRAAAESVGFERAHLLDEALAALLATAIPPGTRNVLVYGWGAGVFSVSVVRMLSGIPQSLCNDGEDLSGTSGLESAIVHHVLDRLGVNFGELRPDRDSLAKLRTLAERVKRGLSKRSEEEFDLNILEFFTEDAATRFQGHSISVMLTRSEFENLIAERVERTLQMSQAALDGAHIEREQLDLILLVGGSTRIPYVERRIRETFSSQLLRAADDAIARGAATHGDGLQPEAWLAREDTLPSRRRVELAKDDAEGTKPSSIPPPSSWVGVVAPGLREAETLWQAGKYQEAVTSIEHVQRELPRFIAHLCTRRAQQLIKTNRLDEALSATEMAIRYAPDDKDALWTYHRACNEKAKLLYKAGALEMARPLLKKAIRAAPECEGCHKLLEQIDAAEPEPRHGFRKKRRRR